MTSRLHNLRRKKVIALIANDLDLNKLEGRALHRLPLSLLEKINEQVTKCDEPGVQVLFERRPKYR